MYWDIFEKLCCDVGKKPNPVGKEIGVSSATISKWKNGATPNGEILIKVANYFKVSTDYLLERTNNPDMYNNSGINIGDIKDNNSNNITVDLNSQQDATAQQFLKIFNELDFEDKAELMSRAVQMKKEK